ncbi:MAG: outer membrane beta-barrel protein [Nitrospira sp.]|nr:outer membrane beta-barrel protein [Nitrospira sp.]
MKVIVSAALLLACILGYSESARAGDEVQVRPIDAYVSGFGGYSFPFKTDIAEGGIRAKDAELNNSPSFGGKVGVWFTSPRKAMGIDLGAEIDVTNFNPNLPGQVLASNLGLIRTNALNLNATYYGINVLARLPMGVTPELPNGRWFPYIGVGGGAQRLSTDVFGIKVSDTAPAFQGLGGVKVFLSKYIAVFAEGKFIHASHTFDVQGGSAITTDLNTFHAVGGLSLHID